MLKDKRLNFFHHLGLSFQRYRWLVIFSWIVLLALCFIYLPLTTPPFKIGGINDPNVESSKAQNLMSDKLNYGNSSIFILYSSKKLTADDPAFMTAVKKSLDGLKNFKLSHRINSPYQNPTQIAENKHSVYAVITFDQASDEVADNMVQFKRLLGKPKDLSVLVGGMPSYIADVKRFSETDLFRAEVIAFPLSIIALLFVFGCVIAAVLPIISGLLSVTMTVTLLFFLGHYFEYSIFVLNIATMLGLGLSLDYTLLMVNRFREELAKSGNTEDAIAITLATAGKTVLFSGAAVLISLSSLLFFPINMLATIGVGGVIVVIISIITALVFLPALLSALGPRINTGRIPWLYRRAGAVKNGHLYKMAMRIMKYPVIVFIITLAFLLMLGYPFLSVNINRPDAKVLPKTAPSRQFLEKYQTEFNPNTMSPIYIVAESKSKSILTDANISALYKLTADLKKDKRVKRISSIVNLDPHFTLSQYQQLYRSPIKLQGVQKEFFDKNTKGRYTIFTLISKYASNAPETYALINKIRSTSVSNQITLKVTGDSAIVYDTIHAAYTQFSITVGIICLITYLVLLLLLRSVFLPLKAIIMNMLSLMVSYGMLVFIYQEGHFGKLLHFDSQGFTDLNLPILLFCALFGLSMDYEIFLLTRIKEFYDKTGDNTVSVALGLERSARIISSAALIMVLVALSFVTADVVFIKAFGLATALAIFIDATVVRLLLVPATMRLLGDWNWYLPRWLDKILPHITHEPSND